MSWRNELEAIQSLGSQDQGSENLAGLHGVDLAFSHPPYGEIILYSAHPDDLSRCTSDEDFHQKLQMVLFNQRQATRPGGHYATLIGDKRKQGKYCSYQAEAIARMPAVSHSGDCGYIDDGHTGCSNQSIRTGNLERYGVLKTVYLSSPRSKFCCLKPL